MTLRGSTGLSFARKGMDLVGGSESPGWPKTLTPHLGQDVTASDSSQEQDWHFIFTSRARAPLRPRPLLLYCSLTRITSSETLKSIRSPPLLVGTAAREGLPPYASAFLAFLTSSGATCTSVANRPLPAQRACTALTLIFFAASLASTSATAPGWSSPVM